MSLSVNIRHRLGAFTLEAAFESGGRLTALFGPSGSGKTSIVADGRVLADTAARISIPMHRRRIGYIFQDARLFPHLSVSQNLRYGRFFTRASERYGTMDSVVELLGIGHLLDRKPGSLSGGEKQRVAIGRALLASPRLILMDEPLAALDDRRKAEIIPYIERLRDETGIPIVYVSHSIAEVARLATDIVVLEQGKVAAFGTTAEILPRLDILPEEERGEGGAVLDMQAVGLDPAYAMTTLASPAGEIHVAGLDVPLGSQVRVRIRARDVIVATQRPRDISALNILAGEIASLRTGDDAFADVTMDCGGQSVTARITRQSAEMLGLQPGLPVFAVVKSVTFDRANTVRGFAGVPAPSAAGRAPAKGRTRIGEE
jgi:molybdate transport system ATP-binding protein